MYRLRTRGWHNPVGASTIYKAAPSHPWLPRHNLKKTGADSSAPVLFFTTRSGYERRGLLHHHIELDPTIHGTPRVGFVGEGRL
jgi:hypothetical protein